jgi:hypothetical protein
VELHEEVFPLLLVLGYTGLQCFSALGDGDEFVLGKVPAGFVGVPILLGDGDIILYDIINA